ncbi:MAG: HlyD family efflux transporter periplasmic adaptor subunit [Clostridium sp.]
MAKSKKIIRYKKPININVGMIIFAMIFVYLSFSVYTYIRRDKIQFYEVVEGSIVNDKIYTGLIFRDETVRQAEKTGYINYYIREGKKASVGAKIYSLDETGQMKTFLEDNKGVNLTMSEDNLYDLKKQLTSICLTYNDNNFSEVYNEKYSLQASVAENINFNALDNMDALLKEKGINYEQVYSDRAGIISYAIDSFEGLEPTAVTEASFDKSTYKRAISKSGLPLETGTPVYKIISSEDWSVVFPISDQDKALYDGKNTMKIKILSGNLTLPGKYSLITGADGKSYGKVDFDKCMVQYVSDRYLDFEIITEEAEGLKIPVSSVVSKEFFTIPIDYLGQGGDASENGFYKEVYSESGEASIAFTPVSIYNSTDEFYYVDKSERSEFKSGDYIVKPDSNERFQIGSTASLNGVYNINKGYAVFKLITEVANNGEYYTIEKGTKYGLSVYDHIVLDAKTVTEGQIIYQ